MYCYRKGTKNVTCRATPASEDALISSFAWLANAQCMEYSEAGEVIERYSNPVSFKIYRHSRLGCSI